MQPQPTAALAGPSSNPNPAPYQACKDCYEELRRQACRASDGCANRHCPERGMAACTVLTADHGTNRKKTQMDKKTKNATPVALSEHKKWPALGGVRAMREEAAQIAKWICHSCHASESTSAQGRINDPSTMAQRDGETDKGFRDRKHKAEIAFPKYAHVNSRKRKLGRCEYDSCGRPVAAGEEAAFDFDHRVESTKRRCRCENAKGQVQGPCHGCEDALFKRKGGVAGLANNHAKAAKLCAAVAGTRRHPACTVKDLLDAEMAKCDLLCRNCHHGRKNRGRARWDDSE